MTQIRMPAPSPALPQPISQPISRRMPEPSAPHRPFPQQLVKRHWPAPLPARPAAAMPPGGGPLPQAPEEPAQVLGQHLGLLHGREVAAARHIGEAAQVPLGPLGPPRGQGGRTGRARPAPGYGRPGRAAAPPRRAPRPRRPRPRAARPRPAPSPDETGTRSRWSRSPSRASADTDPRLTRRRPLIRLAPCYQASITAAMEVPMHVDAEVVRSPEVEISQVAGWPGSPGRRRGRHRTLGWWGRASMVTCGGPSGPGAPGTAQALPDGVTKALSSVCTWTQTSSSSCQLSACCEHLLLFGSGCQ